MENNEREFNVMGYNFLDPKNKKRFTKDLENLSSKELIRIIGIFINSQNKSFKLLDNFENHIKDLKENKKLLEERITLLEDLNNKYEKYFDKFEKIFDSQKD